MQRNGAFRIRGKGTAYRAALPLILWGLLLLSACVPAADATGSAQERAPEAEIRTLIEQGSYAEALSVIAESGELLGGQRTELTQYCRYQLGAAAEAAGDDASALMQYEAAGAYQDAQDRGNRARARLVVADARALFERHDFDGAFTALDAMGDQPEAAMARVAWEEEKGGMLADLFTAMRDRIGAGAWYTVAVVADGTPQMTGDARYDLSALPQAADAVYAGEIGMLFLKDGALSVYGDNFGHKEEIESLTDVVDAAAGINHIIAVRQDGAVSVWGAVQNGRGQANGWTGIAAVAAGAFHSAGLRQDGTCVASGDDTYGQCRVSDWQTVTDIAAGLYHTVGLRADGTCVATGDNTYGQCNVTGWTDVLAVYCGATHTVALKKDFTLVSAGNNASGQCNVEDWQNVVAVACGTWHTVGVQADGRIVFCGANRSGQADTAAWNLMETASFAPEPVETGGTVDEIVYWGEQNYGPWLYLYHTGAVMIVFDEATEDELLRADMFAASGSSIYSAICAGSKYNKVPVPAEQLAREHKTVFGVTGDYMNVTMNPQGIKIRQGEVYNDGEPITGFYYDKVGRMLFVDTEQTDAQELLDLGVTDCWTFGPALLRDGEKLDISQNYFSRHPALRCAVGTMEPYHTISVASGYGRDDGMFLHEIQDVLLGYGAMDAYNMDGGNSAVFLFMGELLNRSSVCKGFTRRGIRPLADLICFLHSDSVPSVDDPYVRGNQPVSRR